MCSSDLVLFLPIGLIVAYRLLKDCPVGNWSTMFRGVAVGVIFVATALAFFSADAVLSLTGGWGGVVGLSIAGLFNWAIGFAGNPTLSWWAGRGLGLLCGLIGLFIWWRSLDFSLPERVSLPSIPSLRGPARPAALAGPEPREREALAEPKIREGREPRKTVVPDNRPGPVIADRNIDRKSTRLNSSHTDISRMPSSA